MQQDVMPVGSPKKKGAKKENYGGKKIMLDMVVFSPYNTQTKTKREV